MLISRLRLATLAASALTAGAMAQNDECATALPVTPGTTPFDTTLATASPEAWPCAAANGPDLWYAVTATSTDDLRIDTCGSTFDTALEAFTGTCGALTSLACNDDTCAAQSALLITSPTPGTTYTFRVGGFQGATGTGVINVATVAPPTPPPAECAETGFVSNNGGNVGGAVYFDLAVAEDVTVSAIELNTTAVGVPVGLSVYVTPTTYVGSELNAAAWTLVARDNGASLGAGTDARTLVRLDSAVELVPGTYGVALVGSNAVTGASLGHRYTNGTGTNQSAQSLNGALSLTLGAAQNVPFTSAPFTPRVANVRLCGATCDPISSDVQLALLATIDLASTSNANNPEFIGSNPSAVAWDGEDLFVAGFNSSGLAATTGIVAVADALTAPVIGAAFGVLSTPNLRGYSGLDIDAAGLAAAFDNGASSADGITFWDGATGTRLWAKAGRGGSGVGIDPGFGGVDPGIGWTTFGSGRRALQAIATGADVYTAANGMIVNGAGTGTFWRDMDFDDTTGDIWLREGNNLIKAVRTGGNSVMTAQLVVDEPEADSVAGQNVAYLGGLGRELVVYNDREVTTANQSFADVVKFVFPDGTPATVDFGGLMALPGIGYYDFSWHAPSQTLALLDFANRRVQIFRVTTEVGTLCCDAAPNSTGVAGRLRATGSLVAAANALTLLASELPASSFCVLLASESLGFVPFAGGGRGHLCLSGPIGRGVGGVIFQVGAGGAFSTPFDLTAVPTPAGSVAAMAGETWYVQGSYRDAENGAATFNFTNALGLTLQ